MKYADLRERERERETDRDRDRQTETETDRHTQSCHHVFAAYQWPVSCLPGAIFYARLTTTLTILKDSFVQYVLQSGPQLIQYAEHVACH